MFDVKLRLISMLGLVTAGVLVCLILDYFHLIRRPYRAGMALAVLGIILGIFLMLSAVLPGSEVYGRIFSRVDTAQKIVALTFDDGPYPPYTNQILDILAERQIRATFFVIGKNVDKHPDLARRIILEGHQIGNHTYDHVDLLKFDKTVIREEIDRANIAIKNTAGVDAKIARPPHGFRDPIVLDVLKSRNYRVVEWSVMSKDWTNPGTDVIVRRTMKNVRNGSVILLHDGDGVRQADSRQQTVEAVRVIIDNLKAQGYKFVTIDELLSEK